MRKLFLTAAAIATIGEATSNKAGACNLRFPTFELAGFPICSHQVALLRGANVVERSPTPTLKLAGMPASPPQIAVLTPRKKAAILVQASVDPSAITVGLASTLLKRASAARQAVCVPDRSSRPIAIRTAASGVLASQVERPACVGHRALIHSKNATTFCENRLELV
jgi:hypothetical protein